MLWAPSFRVTLPHEPWLPSVLGASFWVTSRKNTIITGHSDFTGATVSSQTEDAPLLLSISQNARADFYQGRYMFSSAHWVGLQLSGKQ